MHRQIAIGDRVKFSVGYCRSTAQYTGPVPFARGRVMRLREVAPGFVLAAVKWDRERSVLPDVTNLANLAHEKDPEHCSV
jgi:hypothetical protein